MRALTGDMTGIVAVSAHTPMLIFVHLPIALGSGRMGAAGICVGRCDVLFDIAVTDAAVTAVAPLLFQTDPAAFFAKLCAGSLAAFADIRIMEAIAAILAEVEFILVVLYADGRRTAALRVALAAIQAQLTVFTHIHRAERITTIGAYMFIPIGVLQAVLAAFAAVRGSIVKAAVDTKTAIVAKLDAVFIQAFIALLTENAAFLTVKISILADIVGTVAIAALLAMHQFQFPAALTEAAAVTQAAHTIRTEPAIAAKLILPINIAFTTAQAVPAFVDIAVFTGHTFQTKNRVLEACSAFIAVGIGEAL